MAWARDVVGDREHWLTVATLLAIPGTVAALLLGAPHAHRPPHTGKVGSSAGAAAPAGPAERTS